MTRLEHETSTITKKYSDQTESNPATKKGEKLLGVYANENLMIENTFFTHHNYATYHCKRYETPSMHDIIVVSKGLHK